MGAVPPRPRRRSSGLSKDFWDRFNKDMDQTMGAVSKTVEEMNKMCRNSHSQVGNMTRNTDPKTGQKRVRCGCGAVHLEGFPCHYCKAQPGSENKFMPLNVGPNAELNGLKEEQRRRTRQQQSMREDELYAQKAMNKSRLGDLAIRYDVKQEGNIAGGDIVAGDLHIDGKGPDKLWSRPDPNGDYWALDTLLYAFGSKRVNKVAPAVTKGGAKRKFRCIYSGQRRFWRTFSPFTKLYYWWYGEEDETPTVSESDSDTESQVDSSGEDVAEQTESTEVQDAQLALPEDGESVSDAAPDPSEDQVHERTDS